MKIRDSGMPEEAYWETLFDVALILDRLGLEGAGDVAELGCGYGTFTVPIAQTTTGTVFTFDIDPAMIERTKERAGGLPVVCQLRNVVADGFGVEADKVLLFNILHCDRPVELLRSAAAALVPGGEVVAIHWRDGETPRGPSLEIRPRPEQIIEWAAEAGLAPVADVKAIALAEGLANVPYQSVSMSFHWDYEPAGGSVHEFCSRKFGPPIAATFGENVEFGLFATSLDGDWRRRITVRPELKKLNAFFHYHADIDKPGEPGLTVGLLRQWAELNRKTSEMAASIFAD